MSEHRGRDNQEIPENDPTFGGSGVNRRRVDAGMAGGERAERGKAVDFDDMGDLDMGADDANDAEVATGPGPAYGAPSTGRNTRQRDDQTTLGTPEGDESIDHEAGTLSTPGDFASTMRVVEGEAADITGGMGASTGDEDGMSQGGDMDVAAARGDVPATGTGRRAGLGGTSRETGIDLDPAAGSGMANPANMEAQG